MDDWVRSYFHAQDSILRIMEALTTCRSQGRLALFSFELASALPRPSYSTCIFFATMRDSDREVFAVNPRAARFMMAHHDFMEGVRARILDKDDKPQWRPQRIEDVDLSSVLPQIFAG